MLVLETPAMSSLEDQPGLDQSAFGRIFSKALSTFQSMSRLAIKTKQLELGLDLKHGSCSHIWSSITPPLSYLAGNPLVHMEDGLLAVDMVFWHLFMVWGLISHSLCKWLRLVGDSLLRVQK